MFKDDNLVQLGVLIRSSSLSNQVFESSASSMLNSWTLLVESGSSAMKHHRKPNSSAPPTYNALTALVDPNQQARQALLMGHFERLQWYKASYDVTCNRSLIIRARTNEGFKNATIVCKGIIIQNICSLLIYVDYILVNNIIN